MTNSTTNSESIKVPWFTCFFLMMVFFWATPYDFNYPVAKYHIDTAEAIAGMQHGNKKRQIAIIMLGVFALITLARSKNRFRVNEPLFWFLSLYLLWILCSISWSIEPNFTLRRVFRTLLLWFGAFAIAGRYSIRQLASIVVFVCGITLAMGFVNELRLNTFNPAIQGWRFGGVIHAIPMGWSCGLLALAALSLITGAGKKSYKWFLWFIVVVALIGLVLTKSRMAFLSTMICIGWYSFRVTSGRNNFLILLGCIISGCVGYLILGDMLLHYGVEASTLGRGEEATAQVGTLTGRIPLWVECLKWAKERPVAGYGFDTFLGPKNLEVIARNAGWVASSTHSGYVDAIVGLGYVGAGVLISSVVLAIKRAYDLSKNNASFIFVTSVMMWMSLNLFLEARVLNGTSFMTFFCMVIFARLAFVSSEEWEVY